MTAVVVAIVVAGCGGDSGGESDATAATVPQAKGVKNKVLAVRIGDTLATAKTRPDCYGLDILSLRSIYKFQCPAPAEVRASMRQFEVVDAETFGSAAAVSYRTRDTPQGAVMLMYIGSDSSWAVSRMGLLYDPDLDSSDKDGRAGFGEALDKYLDAVRKRDCDLLYRYSVPQAADGKQRCKPELSKTKQLAKALEIAPDVERQYLGGNGDFGFYSLRTLESKPYYATISVVRTAEGADVPYIVLNTAQGPAPKS